MALRAVMHQKERCRLVDDLILLYHAHILGPHFLCLKAGSLVQLHSPPLKPRRPPLQISPAEWVLGNADSACLVGLACLWRAASAWSARAEIRL